ncbi:hypothetical protein [Natronosalvus vescus]|nr:hypothetical protein [Natronosalvus vescus]
MPSRHSAFSSTSTPSSRLLVLEVGRLEFPDEHGATPTTKRVSFVGPDR